MHLLIFTKSLELHRNVLRSDKTKSHAQLSTVQYGSGLLIIRASDQGGLARICILNSSVMSE